MNWLVFLEIISIIVVSIVVSGFLTKTVTLIAKRQYIPDAVAPFFQGLIKWFIIILAGVLILSVFDIPLSDVLTAMSAVLVLFAIGFVAMWSVLSNILCSFLLLVFPPFRFGDEIELREADKEFGVRGNVINLNLFYTTLKSTEDDDSERYLMRVPNTLFFQRVVYCHEKQGSKKLKFGSMNESGDNA